jgi:hypothetical protein
VLKPRRGRRLAYGGCVSAEGQAENGKYAARGEIFWMKQATKRVVEKIGGEAKLFLTGRC